MQVRRTAAAVVLTCAVAALSGCNTSSLSKQELVVHFVAGAPESDHAIALAHCGHVSPEAVPEPLVTSSLVSNNIANVRFRIDHIDDHDLAQVENCLNKQPGVAGVEIPDLTD